MIEEKGLSEKKIKSVRSHYDSDYESECDINIVANKTKKKTVKNDESDSSDTDVDKKSVRTKNNKSDESDNSDSSDTDDNIDKKSIKTKKIKDSKINTKQVVKKVVKKKVVKKKSDDSNFEDDVKVSVKKPKSNLVKCYPIPQLLILNDEEKFKDAKGNILEIEIREEREHDKCYFKLADVSEGFNLQNLDKSVRHTNSGYVRDEDYKVFLKDSKKDKYKLCSDDSIEKLEVNYSYNAEPVNTTTYLSYMGLLHALFASHNNDNLRHFQNWAMKILFTVQMGSREQKQHLVSKILGYPYESAYEYLSMSKHPIPMVYFDIIGWVKDLRGSMEINEKYKDGMLVCKWGETGNGKNRLYQNNSSLGKIEGAQFSLKYYVIMSNHDTKSAEKVIKDYFKTKDCKLKYDKHTELVVIDPDELKDIKELYDEIQDTYGCSESKNTVKLLKDENKDLKHQLTLKDAEFIHFKDQVKIRDLERENKCLRKNRINNLDSNDSDDDSD